jgi:hypothetical protein
MPQAKHGSTMHLEDRVIVACKGSGTPRFPWRADVEARAAL